MYSLVTSKNVIGPPYMSSCHNADVNWFRFLFAHSVEQFHTRTVCHPGLPSPHMTTATCFRKYHRYYGRRHLYYDMNNVEYRKFLIYLQGGGKCVCLRSFVCLSVCLLARLLKNACVDLDEMLRLDRCWDMDELITF